MNFFKTLRSIVFILNRLYNAKIIRKIVEAFWCIGNKKEKLINPITAKLILLLLMSSKFFIRCFNAPIINLFKLEKPFYKTLS